VAEVTQRPGGGTAPGGDFLHKWGEGGEGMPAETSNQHEHSLLVVVSTAAWRCGGVEQRERGEKQER
jgi:hypothetical protein